MGRTVVISAELYERMEETARRRGFESLEDLLEQWQNQEEELQYRRKVVASVNRLREELFAKYGEMPDSTDLVREDRER